jgi:Holliday junction resolvase
MNIKMLVTVPGSPDGIEVQSYRSGKTYDLSGTEGERTLARRLQDAGYAEEAKSGAQEADLLAAPESLEANLIEKKADEPDEVAVPAAPQNKAIEPAENKSTRKRG